MYQCYKIRSYKIVDKRKLGRRIREQREKNHLTLEELAEKLDTTDGYLKLLEYGQRTHSLSLLIKIACTLNCSFDALLCDYHTGLREDFILNDIAKKMQGLSPERLEELSVVINAMLSYMKKNK